MIKNSSAGVASVNLPPLYAAWINQVLAGPLPSEGKATCEDCAMCGIAAQRPARISFNPATKCCTYMPDLYNFLVGNILDEPNPAFVPGRDEVKARLEKGVAVTPFGIYSSSDYKARYHLAPEAFGHSDAMRCPYYIEEGGRCGVWRYRNATCATWFCKHERGALGHLFWKNVQQLLMVVEENLARWCILQLEPGTEALARLFPLTYNTAAVNTTGVLDLSHLEQKVNPEAYRQLWGNWFGREGEYFRECARLVNRLAWDDVLAICGPETQVYQELLLNAYTKMRDDLPPARLNSTVFQLLPVSSNRIVAQSYSPFDPLELSPRLLGLLHYFDGRPTAEVLEQIEAQEGVRLSVSLVKKLADFQLLLAVQ